MRLSIQNKKQSQSVLVSCLCQYWNRGFDWNTIQLWNKKLNHRVILFWTFLFSLNLRAIMILTCTMHWSCLSSRFVYCIFYDWREQISSLDYCKFCPLFGFSIYFECFQKMLCQKSINSVRFEVAYNLAFWNVWINNKLLNYAFFYFIWNGIFRVWLGIFVVAIFENEEHWKEYRMARKRWIYYI